VTTICSIHFKEITFKVEFLHQAQANQMAHPIALPNERISAFTRIRFATATMIGRKETNQDDPHDLSMWGCVCHHDVL
jgi:hypothetical protein